MLVSVYFDTIVLSFRTCSDEQKVWFRVLPQPPGDARMSKCINYIVKSNKILKNNKTFETSLYELLYEYVIDFQNSIDVKLSNDDN